VKYPPQLPPYQFPEAVFAHGCEYGFDEHDYARIREEFDHVYVAWRRDPGRMEVWAVGRRSGHPHCVMVPARWQWPKVLSDLRQMAYEANNTRPLDHALTIRDEVEARHDASAQAIFEDLDPDRTVHDFSKATGIHQTIQAQVPRESTLEQG